MQEIQTRLDKDRTSLRLLDARGHNLQLQEDFPVHISGPKGTYWGNIARREVSYSHNSFEVYRNQLQELDSAEYGEPAHKKQKRNPFEKRNPAMEQKQHNADIFQRMRSRLNGQGGGHNSRNGSMQRFSLLSETQRVRKLSVERNGTKESKAEMEEKQEESEENPQDEVEMQDGLEEIQQAAEEKSEDEVSNTTQDEVSSEPTRRDGTEEIKVPEKFKDEIAELEARLAEYKISHASKTDRLFYDRLGERETNILIQEIVTDELYEVAKDVYNAEEERLRIKELPEELMEEVEEVLHDGPMEEIIVQKYNVDITRRHFQCLLPGVWLNDEIINFYFQMMADRNAEMVKEGLVEKPSHFFNSFFYTKVSENGYNYINVRRWTRKIDLFSMDKIFIPVNVGNMHWCMATIHMTEKRIQYYDSMNGAGTTCLNVLLRYLRDESEHKKKQKFDDAGWELVSTTPDTPQQNNGSDCGVFSCMFADYLSQGLRLSFKQKDIPFHRHRMVLHISRGFLPLHEEDL